MTAAAGSVLHVRALELARGARQILRGVDLDVQRGEVVALMGLSGSGKTTILRSIAGLERFDGGEIRVDTVTLPPRVDPKVTRRALHQKVGMVFQFHFLFEHLSALDNVCLAPVHVQRTARAQVETRARSLLEHLGVGHRAAAFPRELSGGEAQRVAIARALAVDPPLLLMDEPTASLAGALRRARRDAAAARRRRPDAGDDVARRRVRGGVRDTGGRAGRRRRRRGRRAVGRAPPAAARGDAGVAASALTCASFHGIA
jgi:ABC-type polar amino acid transport system ATPase subunit